MFELLDQINWRALHDAYGPSTGTPKRIRDLASPGKNRREKAMDDLWASICHQGTIYPASVAAIPFLVEIISAPEVADRTPALQLLQALSTGTSYHEVHAYLIFYKEKSQKPGWQEKVREEKSWVAAIHESLIAAVPLIVGVLLKGRDPERIAAASLLATLPDNPAAMDALVAAAAEVNPSVSAAAITAIGSRDDAPVAVLERFFAGATNDLVRTVAAIQIVFHCERNAPAGAVEHLLRHLRAPQPELRTAYEGLPDVGSFLGDLGKALAVAPPAAALEAFPLLYEQVMRSPYPLNPSETFGVLILALMLNPPPDRKWAAAALTQQHRLAIRLVADRAWTCDRSTRFVRTHHGNIVDLLERVGLPTKREDILGLLDGTPEGAQTSEEKLLWSSRPARRPWWKFF